MITDDEELIREPHSDQGQGLLLLHSCRCVSFPKKQKNKKHAGAAVDSSEDPSSYPTEFQFYTLNRDPGPDWTLTG